MGYRVQGKTLAAIDDLLADALALEAAGVIAVVLECVPREAASIITSALTIPTIGIGAGPDCDGQILVFHDLVNLTGTAPAKFVRRYADGQALFAEAIEHYQRDVTARHFPADAESYHLPRETTNALLTREHSELPLQRRQP
jgi:3-methyl-2-oxobutanoate hydroxymethyltransferase